MKTRTVRLMLACAALAVLVVQAMPALAAPTLLFEASDFFIPRPASATDQEGVERSIEVFDLTLNGFADLVGQECSFTVSADNGDSVNENNYAVLRSAGWETDVYDTESTANVTTTVLEDDTHVLGATIEMFNVMIPDAFGTVGTSVDFTVYVDCTSQAVTTTTPTTSPATQPTTTTTITATTTSSSSTTTSVGGDRPTTSTTALVTTSTTSPGSATSQDSTTTIPPSTQGTLPFTGPEGALALVFSALTLLVLGTGGVVAARPRGRHSR